ncbi:MAG: UDP-4-amino-4,6-dideoxy-N-acetyl-beta-L-altrosamine transaminase [Alphaproteobacteria bacterium ADurb.Bin438]|nr:MAG: UDP-4-amino-4,6-dideoxy-N-acetyl-beta-L-altrosamine transaminase [Alphaproteobacteria bacterium ADurb.Bin438]
MAAGLNEGDLLLTSPNTFVASSNVGLYQNAEVDFVDIDEKTYNMSPSALKDKLKTIKKTPKVIIPVHFAGQSCDMKEIRQIAKDSIIIEDCAHAIGGEYMGKKIGCLEYSDMAVFSFHPVKIITTGEGGMVVTNNKELYEKLILFRSHGITRNKDLMNNKDMPAWYYEQISLGYNYRMTEIQAGLGVSQMKRIEEFLIRRREIAKKYDEAFKNHDIITPYQDEKGISAYHLYPVQVNNRDRIFNNLRNKGILVNLHYIPVYLQPHYQNIGFKQGLCPVAESYYEKALSLPMFYSLTNENQDIVIESLIKELK